MLQSRFPESSETPVSTTSITCSLLFRECVKLLRKCRDVEILNVTALCPTNCSCAADLLGKTENLPEDAG